MVLYRTTCRVSGDMVPRDEGSTTAARTVAPRSVHLKLLTNSFQPQVYVGKLNSRRPAFCERVTQSGRAARGAEGREWDAKSMIALQPSSRLRHDS
eukprot:s1034_g5.t2